MSTQVDEDFDLKEVILATGSFGPTEIAKIQQAISQEGQKFSQLRDAVKELADRGEHTPAEKVRLGVGYFLLGGKSNYINAIDALQDADRGALAYYYLGRAQFSVGEHDNARLSFESAQKAGYDANLSRLAVAETYRVQGDHATSLRLLDEMHGPIESTAEYLYQRGATISSIGGNPGEVVALFERAVQNDPTHVGALFGLALENERRGNDETALELYEKAAKRFPTHVGVLLNLGILYEDREQYEKAKVCYKRILDVQHDPRAQLYMKDVLAAADMHYDEEAAKRRDKLSQVLNVPVTDFELSVRSRNCLQKMGIRTLGDLTKVSEQELMGSKNFGETSLIEIRQMMESRNLKVGQFVHEKPPSEAPVDFGTVSPDEQAIMDRPISELSLSVRARKCMVRLGLNTMGELLRKSADDLLECKNFGVTSLNEVRQKLGDMGLKLRGE
jgi:DNA-directed RNA polymerase subunit alpha